MDSIAQRQNSPDLMAFSANDVARLVYLLAERRLAAQRMPTHPTDDDLSTFLACDMAVDALMSRLEAETVAQEVGAD